MTCPRCGSDRLYQFEASPNVRVTAAPLPLVCRKCGRMTLGGKEVNLPEELERQAMEMAEAARAAGKETRAALEDEGKDARIEAYFANVYRKAYLDGFFRCLAFYQHHVKEGRLRRMRELWKDSMMEYQCHEPEGETIVVMPTPSYTEFEQLLHLSVAPEKPNAESPSNKRPPVSKGAP
jgi:hypothetical protein